MSKRYISPGEVDLTKNVLVTVVSDKGPIDIWVRIIRGDKCKGQGIVDDEPKAFVKGVTLGTVIRYEGGTPDLHKRPRFTSKVHVGNQKQVLIEAIASDLKERMFSHLTRR